MKHGGEHKQTVELFNRNEEKVGYIPNEFRENQTLLLSLWFRIGILTDKEKVENQLSLYIKKAEGQEVLVSLSRN